MKSIKKILIFFALFLSIKNFSQNQKIDSLLGELKKWDGKVGLAADTNLYNICFKLGKQFRTINPDSAILFFKTCVVKSIQLKDDLKSAESNRQIGWCYFISGNFNAAKRKYDSTLLILKSASSSAKSNIISKKIETLCFGNLGSLYVKKGDYNLAISFLYQALKINEELENNVGAISNLNELGVVYLQTRNSTKAIYYLSQALAKNKLFGDKVTEASLQANLGNLYYDAQDYQKALDFYLKSLENHESLKSSSGNVLNYIGIANCHLKLKNYSLSLEYFKKSLVLIEKINDRASLVAVYINLSELYSSQKKDVTAESYLKQAVEIAKELELKEHLAAVYYNLSNLYARNNRPALALEAYKKHIQYRDSLESEENQKALVQKEMQYEFAKKQAADSLKVVQEKQVAQVKLDEEKSRNKLRLILGSVVLLLVIVFAAFMYNRFKVTQKQKTVIELKEKETQHQKHIIEEKHKEITDSINYAERIQRSFLATQQDLDAHLKDYFILFKPKDVVSGDFFWSASLSPIALSQNDRRFYLATADSTGHGVPGAIMSLLNITSLERALEHHSNPDDVLNHTRKTIIERLKKDGSTDGGKDGMDCSLLCFDFENKKLQIAAANNPVWIVRNSKELIEIKPDKMPVGKHDKQDTPFTLHEIDLQTGDVVYTLTDGFPDQFGGDAGKKFMIKKLREYILTIVHLPMQKQKSALEDTFIKWIGPHEQIDDVTLIGIRV
jgi:serine phosphatase RsbU (regulator of sigma subunit)